MSNHTTEYITEYLTECVQTRTPVVFAKYGDGEYAAACFWYGANCDKTPFTQKLGECLKNSFKYLNTTKNAYFGLWHDIEKKKLWENLTGGNSVRWVNYHSILIDRDDISKKTPFLTQKIQLYKTIKESPLKKIVICNPLLIKIQGLLNIDHVINVDVHNWFELEYDNVINKIQQLIQLEPQQYIILTCCGIGAKILIADLHKKNPENIYLDCGSAFDYICTKRDSRGGGEFYSYEQLREHFLELLPNDWEDNKYLELYKEADIKLGCHLPR